MLLNIYNFCKQQKLADDGFHCAGLLFESLHIDEADAEAA